MCIRDRLGQSDVLRRGAVDMTNTSGGRELQARAWARESRSAFESLTDRASCIHSDLGSSVSMSPGMLRNSNLRHTRTMPLVAPAAAPFEPLDLARLRELDLSDNPVTALPRALGASPPPHSSFVHRHCG